VSDEDYWASVAADRPLPATAPSQEADATQVMGTQASAAPGRPAPAGYSGNESRAGRLGPPPGLNSGPYPRPARNSGPIARPGMTPGGGVPGAGRPAAGQPSFQPSDSRFDSTERFDRIDRPRDRDLASYTDPRIGQDRRPPEHRQPEHRQPEHRQPEHRAGGGRHSAGWPGADDDPLTSKAYSREAMAESDSRSYRAAAARRPQVPDDRYEAALSEQTQTFTVNGQYPSDPQAATARYPVRGQQPQQPQRPQAPQHGAPGSRATTDRNPSYPYPEQQPYPPRQPLDRDEDDPYGRPGAGRHAGNGYGGQGNARRGNGRY
jgi:hypothetical protein